MIDFVIIVFIVTLITAIILALLIKKFSWKYKGLALIIISLIYFVIIFISAHYVFSGAS